MNAKKIIASLMLLSATIMWGLNYSIQQMSASVLGPYTVVFVKGIGCLLLIPILIARRSKISRSSIIGGLVIGVFSFLGCVFQQLGIEASTVSKASFITALYIVMVPLIEVFRGKRFSLKLWLAVALTLVGLYFLCFSGSFSLSIGDAYLLLGSFLFAWQIIAIDHYSRKDDALVLTFTSQVAVSLLSGIMMFLVEKPVPAKLKGVFWLILYMMLFAGVIAQCIQMIYQKETGAALASLIMSLESVFGALGGWLILNQTMNARELFGSLLVFIAILLAE